MSEQLAQLEKKGGGGDTLPTTIEFLGNNPSRGTATATVSLDDFLIMEGAGGADAYLQYLSVTGGTVLSTAGWGTNPYGACVAIVQPTATTISWTGGGSGAIYGLYRLSK